eukprot:scaffold11400_cov134-Isochrysis_galbana.AAC.3
MRCGGAGKPKARLAAARGAKGGAHVALSLMNCLGKPSAPPPVIAISPSTTIGSWLSTLSIGDGTPGS